MAFPGTPTRTTYVSATSNSTSWAAFSGVSVADGSIAVFIVSSDGNPTLTVGGSDTAWTKIDQASNGTIVTGAVFWYFNNTGSSATKAFTLSSTASEQYSGILLIIPRATAGYTVKVEGTNSNGSSTNSNPPSLSPSVGTKDHKWIATRSGDSTVVATVAPTNYSNLQTRAAGGTGGASTNTAERDLNGSTEDPGTFTSASEQWVCWTLAVWEEPTVYSLTANDVDSGTPSVGSPSITQKHALTATGVASSAPSVGAPTLSQVFALTATGVSAGTSTVGAPALGITHALTTNPITSGTPTVGAPAIAQVHDLASTGVDSAAPSVGSPAIAQIHGLAATGIAASAPSVGNPAIGQVHDLTAAGVASSAPSVGSPALSQIHGLTATGVASSAPTVGAPTLAEGAATDALGTPPDVEAGTPTVGAPTLAEVAAPADARHRVTIRLESRAAVFSLDGVVVGESLQDRDGVASISRREVDVPLESRLVQEWVGV